MTTHLFSVTFSADISHNPAWEWASADELSMIRQRLSRGLPAKVRIVGSGTQRLRLERVRGIKVTYIGHPRKAAAKPRTARTK